MKAALETLQGGESGKIEETPPNQCSQGSKCSCALVNRVRMEVRLEPLLSFELDRGSRPPLPKMLP